MAFSVSMQDSAVSEMNITPLVDVMLVLLVIFMVSVPIISAPLQASLPQPSVLVAPVPPPALQLDIAADGRYHLDGRSLSLAELQLQLEDALIAGEGRASLAIRANSDTDYQAVVAALAAARSSGLTDIAVIP